MSFLPPPSSSPETPWPGLALLLLVPAPTLGVLAAMWLWPGAIGSTVWAISKLWLLAFPLLWWGWVARGRWSLSPMRRGGFWPGMISGGVIAAIIVVAGLWLGPLVMDRALVREKLVAVGLGSPVLYVAMCLYWICINSVLEEYVWRWFVYRQFRAITGHVLAVIAAGLAFTLHHVLALGLNFGWEPVVVILGSLGVLIGGLTWSTLYARYGSIWPGWISHAWADIGVFLVGGWILFGA